MNPLYTTGDMTGAELKKWRLQFFSSMAKAGQWYGVSWRTWHRYEHAKKIPLHVENRITGIQPIGGNDDQV